MKPNKKLVQLLPEGLDDSVVTEIADLINEIVDDQVSAQITILETKVKAFLRSRVDIIKEHACSELTLENEDYRNARIFEDIKTLVLLEAKADDENSAISLVKENVEKVQKEVDEDIAVLLGKIEQLSEENKTLGTANKALRGKTSILENKVKQISETVEARKKPFKSSERARVVKENVDKATTNPVVNEQLLSLISEESMKLMP